MREVTLHKYGERACIRATKETTNSGGLLKR